MRTPKSRLLPRLAPWRAILFGTFALAVVRPASSHGVDEAIPDPSPAQETGPFSDPIVSSAVSVPLALSSRPGAPYTIYLDFGGFSFTGLWGNNAIYSPGDTPAYTNDGDATTFSASELANMKAIWSRVAEKFAWANVNVTTMDPAVAAGQAGSDLARQNYYDSQPGMMHTVIGGNGGWTSGGGIGFVGVTGHTQVGTNGDHTDFVFSAQNPNRLPFVAEAAAHENGHGLGLSHQSDYDGTTLLNEYSTGTGIGPGSKAPTMGNAYSAERGLWKIGTAHVLNGGMTIQNDVATILNVNANPGIAIADDGVGHTLATATPLPLVGVAIDFNLATGVIAPTSSSPATGGAANYSTDCWSFTAPGGPMSISAIAGRETIVPGVADPGATLDATLRLLDSMGNVVAESATSSLSETISTDLVPGDYFAEVTSAADPTGSSFFDLGSYFLVGAVPEPPSVLLLAIGTLVLFAAGSRNGRSMRNLIFIVWAVLLAGLEVPWAMAQSAGESAKKNPVVVIKTEFGDITAELYADKAPVTVANFLHYITEKKIHNPTFYRVVRTDPDNQPDKAVKIQVLQGGLTDVPDEELPKIQHETTKMTGVLHKDGVLSMARDEPGTATHHFSICIGDQPELDFGGKRNPDGQGFAAFGKVIKGMDVVKKIHEQPAEGQSLKPKIKMLEVKVAE